MFNARIPPLVTLASRKKDEVARKRLESRSMKSCQDPEIRLLFCKMKYGGKHDVCSAMSLQLTTSDVSPILWEGHFHVSISEQQTNRNFKYYGCDGKTNIAFNTFKIRMIQEDSHISVRED